MKDIIRRCHFQPYLKGAGPTFALTIWDTGRYDRRGQTVLGYRLNMDGALLFQGEDFAGSPCHADDADETVAALMSFLTLRPGDTDRAHFDTYTPRQLAFCDHHAEALSATCFDRFGEC